MIILEGMMPIMVARELLTAYLNRSPYLIELADYLAARLNEVSMISVNRYYCESITREMVGNSRCDKPLYFLYKQIPAIAIGVGSYHIGIIGTSIYLVPEGVGHYAVDNLYSSISPNRNMV